MKNFAQHRQAYLQNLFRTIDIPEDLATVTDIDTAGEVDPVEAALDPQAVAAIWEATRNLYRTGVYPLLSLCLRRRGKIVLNRSLGHYRDGKVASINTPICLYSASKAVTAVLVHLLAEQGRVNLLNPVSYYIPAFAANGKGSITIHQLLAHRGGVPSLPEGMGLETLCDHDAVLKIICEAEPTDHQARIQAYHAVTSGFIMNELIKVTAGQNAQQYLNQYIRRPMGMRYFRYGLTAREQANVAINATTGPDIGLVNKVLTGVLGAHPQLAVEMTNDPRFYQALIPSVNLFATAEEVSRFYQMLLDHGRWQGKQILDPLTVQRAVRPLGKSEIDKTLMLPMRYSAGFMLGGTPFGIFGSQSQYAYGHLGYANIFCWADPLRDISVSLINTGKLALGPHLKALPELMGALSIHCPPVADMETDLPVYRRSRPVT